MENLNLQDAGPQPPLGPASMMGQQQQQPQQLPPQMFTTAAQLLDLTDKKLMVALRDGRKLVGVLRSWDQFANLVLQSTTERLFYSPPSHPSSLKPSSLPSNPLSTSLAPSSSSPPSEPGLYADVPHGTFLVRGENVLLLGEIDLDKDDDAPPGFVLADLEVVRGLIKGEKGGRSKYEKKRAERLRAEGFVGDEDLV